MADPLPGQCTDLRVVKNVVGSVSLEWTVGEVGEQAITGFAVRWAEDAEMRREKGRAEVPGGAQTQQGSVVYCTVTGVHPGDPLHFQVAAQSGAGTGPWSQGTGEVVACPLRDMDPPPQPAPPTCGVKTATTFLVAVDEPSGLAGKIRRYEVRWDTTPMMLNATPCQGSMRLADGGAAGRRFEYAATGFTGRGPYYFSVRAVNDAGTSRWSAPSQAQKPVLDLPAQMAAPALVEVQSTTSMLLSYIATADLGTRMGGGLTAYEMRYARHAELLHDDARMGGVTSTEAVRALRWDVPPHGKPPPVRVGGLLTGRSYVFQIRAISDVGAGLWSEPSAPFKTHSSLPERPPPITAEGGGTDNPFSVNIRMTMPEPNGEPITSVDVRYLGPNFENRPKVTEWTDVDTLSALDCDREEVRLSEPDKDASEPWLRVWQFTVHRLEAGASHRFMYRCTNAIGTSEWSDPSSQITTPPTVPSKNPPPFIKHPGDLTSSSITMHWEEPHNGGSNITHYTVEWANNPRFMKPKVVEVFDSHCTFSGLVPKQWYYFKVTPSNAVGPGRSSDLDPQRDLGCFQTLKTVPGPVQDVKVNAVQGVAGAVYVMWNKPAEVGGGVVSKYRIVYADNAAFENQCSLTHKALRECKITDLKPDTLYFFAISASTSVGEGPLSEPAQCRTNPEKKPCMLPRLPSTRLTSPPTPSHPSSQSPMSNHDKPLPTLERPTPAAGLLV